MHIQENTGTCEHGRRLLKLVVLLPLSANWRLATSHASAALSF